MQTRKRDAIAWSETLAEGTADLGSTDNQTTRDGASPSQKPSGRRLSDKILVAFHHACDLGDFEVAQELLRIFEMMLIRKPMPNHVGRRRSMESLVAAHERLWQLRNPDAEP